MQGLSCTICGMPAFMSLRAEITTGAITYLICWRPNCVNVAADRMLENLHNAAHKEWIKRNAINSEAEERSPQQRVRLSEQTALSDPNQSAG